MMHQKSEKNNGNTPPQKKTDGKRIKIKVEINEVEMKRIQKAT